MFGISHRTAQGTSVRTMLQTKWGHARPTTTKLVQRVFKDYGRVCGYAKLTIAWPAQHQCFARPWFPRVSTRNDPVDRMRIAASPLRRIIV